LLWDELIVCNSTLNMQYTKDVYIQNCDAIFFILKSRMNVKHCECSPTSVL